MNNTQCPQVSGSLKCVVHSNIIDSEDIVVGHKELKARDTLLYHSFHFILSIFVPLRNCWMECIIAINFPICPISPFVICLWKRLALLRNREVYEWGGASCHSSLTPWIKIIDSICAHEWQLHVSMGINASWDDELIRAIDNCCWFMGYVRAHRGDLAMLNKDINHLGYFRIDNLPILEEIAIVKPRRYRVHTFSERLYHVLFFNVVVILLVVK